MAVTQRGTLKQTNLGYYYAGFQADGVHASPRSSLDSARSIDTSSAPPSPPLRRVVGVLRRVTRRAWHLAAGNSQSAARPRQKYRVAQRSSPLASGLVNLTREVPPSTHAVPVCGKGTSLVHPSVLASEHGRPPTHTPASQTTPHIICVFPLCPPLANHPFPSLRPIFGIGSDCCTGSLSSLGRTEKAPILLDNATEKHFACSSVNGSLFSSRLLSGSRESRQRHTAAEFFSPFASCLPEQRSSPPSLASLPSPLLPFESRHSFHPPNATFRLSCSTPRRCWQPVRRR